MVPPMFTDQTEISEFQLTITRVMLYLTRIMFRYLKTEILVS